MEGNSDMKLMLYAGLVPLTVELPSCSGRSRSNKCLILVSSHDSFSGMQTLFPQVPADQSKSPVGL